jgi:flagellar protein FlbD
MIVLTRLNGPSFALNPDLIERVEANPDTVVVLIGGASYPIAESVEELLARVRHYRGQVIASAHAAEFSRSDFGQDLDQSGSQRNSGQPDLGDADFPPVTQRKLRILPLPDAE